MGMSDVLKESKTALYGPSFFLLMYGPSMKRAGHKSIAKNKDL